jgi:predicted transcriptional regulator
LTSYSYTYTLSTPKLKSEGGFMKNGKMLTPREAAVVLGCGMKRLYELLYSQKIEATKTNDRWAIPVSAIECRLKERETRRLRVQHAYRNTRVRDHGGEVSASK